MASVMEPSTRTLAIDVKADILDRLDAAAERKERPRASIIEEALRDWIEVEDFNHRAMIEGMAEARAGKTVDNERAIAWINSLGTDRPLPMPVA